MNDLNSVLVETRHLIIPDFQINLIISQTLMSFSRWSQAKFSIKKIESFEIEKYEYFNASLWSWLKLHARWELYGFLNQSFS